MQCLQVCCTLTASRLLVCRHAHCVWWTVGLLKTLGANKDAPLPVKLFEVSDVIFLDSRAEAGARNQRRLAAVHISRESGFEIIHGLLNRVMEVLGVARLPQGKANLLHWRSCTADCQAC